MKYCDVFSPDGSTGRNMTVADARELGGGQPISDSTINGVLHLGNLFEPTRDAVLLDAGFLNQLETLIDSSGITAATAQMLVSTAPPTHGNRSTCVLMPYCFDHSDENAAHWVLIVLHRRTNQWLLFSSLNGYQQTSSKRRKVQRLVDFCAQRWNRKRSHIRASPAFIESECQQQDDHVSCGIFVIENVATLFRDGTRLTDLRHVNVDPTEKRKVWFEALFGISYHSADWGALEPVQYQRSIPSCPNGSEDSASFSSSNDETENVGAVNSVQILGNRRRQSVFDQSLGSEVIFVQQSALMHLPAGSYRFVGNQPTEDYLVEASVDAIHKFLPRNSWKQIHNSSTDSSPASTLSPTSSFGSGSTSDFGSDTPSQQGPSGSISKLSQSPSFTAASLPSQTDATAFTPSLQPVMPTIFTPSFQQRQQVASPFPPLTVYTASLFQVHEPLYTTVSTSQQLGTQIPNLYQPSSFANPETGNAFHGYLNSHTLGYVPWYDSSDADYNPARYGSVSHPDFFD
ncbi:Cysteine proteinase [Glarea lozoyensis ATCC 20868]|uniref:Cysteine proteinase n=1 Tax=Glarea lozoyensis (strain ATCC 20868 / MF5171) TaxID=1116229 RepID=S3D5H1_GLAL2|nr:Cysteine proteinase [Glarea lozoyensis ATCC 20868]EPE32349.1 Cysteine proteinase [Glarea lozoyensis ATCC 20868]